MTNDPQLYRKMLTSKAYPNEQGMMVRKKTHELYTVPTFDFQNWVLERLGWRGDEAVLDLGCGPGTYLPALTQYIAPQQYVGVDLSLGMLKAVKQEASLAAVTLSAADAEALPFPDHSFDVVLANHMLYHIPNLDQALSEVHRVLRPHGLLVAATNSQFTMPEFNTLIQRAFRVLGQSPDEHEGLEQTFLRRFSLETGTVKLAHHFRAVVRYDVPSALVFSEVKPVMDYINSTRPFYEPHMPPEVAWEDFITIMSDQVRRLVDHFGELTINKLAGVIIATDQGGFATDYLRLLDQASLNP